MEQREPGESDSLVTSAHEATEQRSCVADELAGICDPLGVLECVVQQSDHPIMVFDLDGAILMWNPAAGALTGWSVADALGMDVGRLLVGSRESTLRRIHSIAAADEVDTRQVRVVRKDGSRMRVQLMLAPLQDRQSHVCGVLGIAFGLAEDARFDVMRRDFVDLASTELRGPLTAVLGYAELLTASDVLEDTAERQVLVRALKERCVQLSTLVDDLFLLSGLLEPEEPRRSERFDPCQVVDGVVRRMSASGDAVEVQVDGTCRTQRVAVDRLRFEQVVQGLIAAAIEAGPSRAVSVKLGVSNGFAIAEIACADHAPDTARSEPGPRSVRNDGRVLERTATFGTGLRLRVAERFAEVYGGDVSGSFDPERGSTFVLRLPLDRPEDA